MKLYDDLIEDLKKRALLEERDGILRSLTRAAGLRMDQVPELGFRLYDTDLMSYPGEDLVSVFWIGKKQNEEGFNVRGGMVDKDYLYAAKKVIVSLDPRSTRMMPTVKIESIEWEDLTDLLYDNLMRVRSREQILQAAEDLLSGKVE